MSAEIAELPTEERDLALGRFMDAWSELEANLRALLSVLSGAPAEASFSIAAAIPDTGRLRDLLLALGRLQLEDGRDQTELSEICEYLLIQNRYRNSIVHGQWLLTNNRAQTSVRGVVHPYMWVRAYTLVDKTKEFNAVLGRDVKAEDQYVFTVERLEQRVQKVRDFSGRISKLTEEIRGRVRLPKRGL
jgi:hypothetical protein